MPRLDSVLNMLPDMAARSPQMSTSPPSPTPDGINVSNTDLNPVIQVLAWLLLSFTTLMLGFRLLTSYFVQARKKLSIEEVFIVIAYLFGLGQTVAWLIPQGIIFGKSLALISPDELKDGLKAGYVGDICFLLSLGFAKLSVCYCLFSLSPDQVHRRICMAVGGSIILWLATGLLTWALRCGSHGPWDTDATCLNQKALLTYLEISNIITDGALVLLPIVIIAPTNLPFKNRATAIILFTSRILVFPAVICQIIYTPRLFDPDFTLRAFPYYVSTEMVQFASISTACLTYLWPFFRSLQSGMINHRTFPSRYTLVTLPNKAGSGNPAAAKTGSGDPATKSADPRTTTTGETRVDKQTTTGSSSGHKDRGRYIEITTDYAVDANVVAHPPVPGADYHGESYRRMWRA